MDYQASVAAVLESIGSRHAPLASGAATALALSLGVECLALAAALSRRESIPNELVEYLDQLDARIREWRRVTAQGFVDDPVRFGHVLAARTARDAAPAQDRHAHVEREIDALTAATSGLIELLRLGLDLEDAAATMSEGRCVSHALGEVATARALARASNEAVLAMASSNLDAMRRRGRLDSVSVDVEPLGEAAASLPEGRARDALESYLGDSRDVAEP